jgi:hypothetical protein
MIWKTANNKDGKDNKDESIDVVVDVVNQPPHYKVGGIETIDYLEAKLSPEAFKGFLHGNTLKYLSRANHKNNATEDFKKAQWYLNKLVEVGNGE